VAENWAKQMVRGRRRSFERSIFVVVTHVMPVMYQIIVRGTVGMEVRVRK